MHGVLCDYFRIIIHHHKDGEVSIELVQMMTKQPSKNLYDRDVDQDIQTIIMINKNVIMKNHAKVHVQVKCV